MSCCGFLNPGVEDILNIKQDATSGTPGAASGGKQNVTGSARTSRGRGGGTESLGAGLVPLAGVRHRR
jgi:hypothetical protein